MSGAALLALPTARVLSVLVGTWLFARRLPRRPRFIARIIFVAIVFMAIVAYTDWLGFARFDFFTREYFLAWGLITRLALLIILFTALLACFKTSVWNVLFCANLGFTLESIAEGITMVCENMWGSSPSITLMYVDALSIILCSAAIHLLMIFTYVRAVDKSGVQELHDDRLLAVFAEIVLVVIAFGQLTQALNRIGADNAIVTSLEVVRMAMCAFILFASYEILYSVRLRSEMAAIESLMRSREHQYLITRETIDAINVKCHDIRHQIRSLGQAHAEIGKDVLDDIAREVSVYDTRIRTGNDSLDTILTEKSLICEQAGITFSCIADGSPLSFLQPSEIYSLFGNALDNAIEASRMIEDVSKRTISLSVREIAGMVSIHIENRFLGDVVFKDGIPQTTKADSANHGFGTKSMMLAVERQGGAMTMEALGDIFCLDAVIPAS